MEGGLRNALLDHSDNNVKLVDKIQIFRLRKKDFVEGDLGGLLSRTMVVTQWRMLALLVQK